MNGSHRKQRVGEVVNDKSEKTVVVAVEWRLRHPLYKKSMRRITRFHVHDERNECKIGDQVRITETRPISKTKRWRVVEILKRREMPDAKPWEIGVPVEEEEEQVVPAAEVTAEPVTEVEPEVVVTATEAPVAEAIEEVLETETEPPVEESVETAVVDEVTETGTAEVAEAPESEVEDSVTVTEEAEAPQDETETAEEEVTVEPVAESSTDDVVAEIEEAEPIETPAAATEEIEAPEAVEGQEEPVEGSTAEEEESPSEPEDSGETKPRRKKGTKE